MNLIVTASEFDFQTARLHIQPLCQADKALYMKLYTDERVMRFIGPALSAEKAEQSFNNALKLNADPHTERLFLTVKLLEAKEASAMCCISHLDRQKGIAEIGNMVLPAAQGKQIAQEATKALMCRIQQMLAINHFVMDISENNLPAIRGAKSLGFRPDKSSPTSYFVKLIGNKNE